jgi:hypothetical protein
MIPIHLDSVEEAKKLGESFFSEYVEKHNLSLDAINEWRERAFRTLRKEFDGKTPEDFQSYLYPDDQHVNILKLHFYCNTSIGMEEIRGWLQFWANSDVATYDMNVEEP